MLRLVNNDGVTGSTVRIPRDHAAQPPAVLPFLRWLHLVQWHQAGDRRDRPFDRSMGRDLVAKLVIRPTPTGPKRRCHGPKATTVPDPGRAAGGITRGRRPDVAIRSRPVGEDATTGLLVAGPANLPGQIGKNEESRRQARRDELDEVVKTVGATFLGLTGGCALPSSGPLRPPWPLARQVSR